MIPLISPWDLRFFAVELIGGDHFPPQDCTYDAVIFKLIGTFEQYMDELWMSDIFFEFIKKYLCPCKEPVGTHNLKDPISSAFLGGQEQI